MAYDDKTVKIIFGGDLYCKSSDLKISSSIIDLFSRHDEVILNLEAPFSDKNNFKQKSGPSICQGSSSLEILNKLKVTHVGCANNHIMDAGLEGLQFTQKILKQNSIKFFGFGLDSKDAEQGISLEDTGIVVLGVGEEEFGVADKDIPGINSMYQDTVIDYIENNKDGKFIIVYAHGGPEKEPLPSKYIVNRYREFIDHGAKLVVGHHPHVVQGFEEYNGGHIFYSLGNLFHEMYPKNVGALLSLEILANKIHKYSLEPIAIQNGQLDFLKSDVSFKTYLEICNNIIRNPATFNQVHQEQATSMYDSYYQAYFMSLFGYRNNLLSKINLFLRRILGGYKNKILQMQKSSESLILNMIRNKSHNEFIETALKLKLGEVAGLKNNESSRLYKKLKGGITYE